MPRKMEQAIAALLTCRNDEEAARMAGIGVNTLRRWKKNPEFAAEFLIAKKIAYDKSISRLTAASDAAVSTVLRIMVDENAPASVRVNAAGIVLDRGRQAIDTEFITAVTEIQKTASPPSVSIPRALPSPSNSEEDE
jgi:hypothetical protein